MDSYVPAGMDDRLVVDPTNQQILWRMHSDAVIALAWQAETGLLDWSTEQDITGRESDFLTGAAARAWTNQAAWDQARTQPYDYERYLLLPHAERAQPMIVDSEAGELLWLAGPDLCAAPIRNTLVHWSGTERIDWHTVNDAARARYYRVEHELRAHTTGFGPRDERLIYVSANLRTDQVNQTRPEQDALAGTTTWPSDCFRELATASKAVAIPRYLLADPIPATIPRAAVDTGECPCGETAGFRRETVQCGRRATSGHRYSLHIAVCRACGLLAAEGTHDRASDTTVIGQIFANHIRRSFLWENVLLDKSRWEETAASLHLNPEVIARFVSRRTETFVHTERGDMVTMVHDPDRSEMIAQTWINSLPADPSVAVAAIQSRTRNRKTTVLVGTELWTALSEHGWTPAPQPFNTKESPLGQITEATTFYHRDRQTLSLTVQRFGPTVVNPNFVLEPVFHHGAEVRNLFTAAEIWAVVTQETRADQ